MILFRAPGKMIYSLHSNLSKMKRKIPLPHYQLLKPPDSPAGIICGFISFLICRWLEGFFFFLFFYDSMNSSFQSSTQTVISLSDVAPPPAQCLSALANPGYAALLSDLFKTCLWIIHTCNPLILHLQVQKQRAHTLYGPLVIYDGLLLILYFNLWHYFIILALYTVFKGIQQCGSKTWCWGCTIAPEGSHYNTIHPVTTHILLQANVCKRQSLHVFVFNFMHQCWVTQLLLSLLLTHG